MKKFFVVAMAMALVALAGTAMAAGSANLTVQATVVAGCGINSTSPVAFTIDPASASDALASGGANVWCANGTVGTVALGAGAHDVAGEKYMTSSTVATTIRYSLAIPAGSETVTGAGKAVGIAVPINGTVAAADFTNALPALDYSDTVLVTITP